VRAGPSGSLVNVDRPDQDPSLRPSLPPVRRPPASPGAAGGVGGPEEVADLLTRGADMVGAGTAFLRCPRAARRSH